MKPRTYIEYVLDETYKFNLQSSIFNKIYNFLIDNTNIIKQKQYILLLSRLMCKKMFEQKRFAGRHLLTFESQKLNYFDITM